MKFLVIGRNTGADHGLDADSGAASGAANAVRGMIADGTVEAAYALLSGGYAYVINAEDATELAYKVRSNALFSSSHTEIHPIADAADFLDGVAKHLS